MRGTNIMKVALIGSQGNWPLLSDLTGMALKWLSNPTNCGPMHNTAELASICGAIQNSEVTNSKSIGYINRALAACIEAERDMEMKKYASKIAGVPVNRPQDEKAPPLVIVDSSPFNGPDSNRPQDEEKGPSLVNASVRNGWGK